MREYVRQQTSVLLRRFAFQLNRAAKLGDEECIHDLRVAIRRLSRCLRVFSQFYPKGSWKKLRRELSVLMDTAAEVRDRDIALACLAGAGVPRKAAIVTELVEERRKAGSELVLEARRWKSRSFSRKWRGQLELE